MDDDDEPIRRRKKHVPLLGLALIGVLVVAVGGLGLAAYLKHKKSGTAGNAAGRAADDPVAKPIPALRLRDEYAENPIAADGRYRGNRVRVDVMVEKIGRQDGRAYAAYSDIATPSEPVWFFYFDAGDEPELARVRVGQRYVIEGKCRGYERDEVFRGIRGRDWRVTFTGCRVIGPGRDQQ